MPVLGLPSAKSLLPVIDSQPELDVTAEQWRSVAGIVKTGLKDVERLPENLRDDQRGPLQEWIDILPQVRRPGGCVDVSSLGTRDGGGWACRACK